MLINKIRLVSALLAAGLLAVGAALAGAGRDGDRNSDPQPASPGPKVAAVEPPPAEGPPLPHAPIVRLTKPQPGGLDRVKTFQSVVEPSNKANLLPAAAGVLKRVDADIGDRVKAGQLLAEIDAPALALDERQAVIGVQQAEGGLKEAAARVATAKAEIVAAKGAVLAREAEVAATKATVAFRKKQFDRLKALTQAGAVDQGAVDESEAHLRTAEGLADAAAVGVANAKTDLLVKEAKLDQTVAGMATAELNIKAAQIGLERARLAIAQTRITAPFDGLVARRGCAVGQVVRPSERSDEPLFAIVRTDVVRIVFSVHQYDLGAIEPGRVVEVEFLGNRVTGKVARVGATLDPASVSARAEIDLPNLKGDIRPGMFGSVIVKLAKGPADAVRVPASAVFEVAPAKPGDSTTSVYVYKDEKARMKPVRVTHQDSKEAEVASGLAADDLVVIDPQGLPRQAEIAVEVKKPAPPK